MSVLAPFCSKITTKLNQVFMAKPGMVAWWLNRDEVVRIKTLRLLEFVIESSNSTSLRLCLIKMIP